MPYLRRGTLRRRSTRGLSLIELMIAAVIAASAGVLLMHGLLAANRSAEGRIESARLTQALADRLALLDETLSSKTPTSGTVPPPFADTTWTLDWHPTALKPIAEATLTVSHHGRSASVVTYRPIQEP